MPEVKELRILLEIMDKSKVHQQDMENQVEVFGSSSTISKAVNKLEREGLLHRQRPSKKGTAYPINVWSLKTDYESFKRLVEKFLNSRAFKLEHKFLEHKYLWKRLKEFRNKIELPFFLLILQAFLSEIPGDPLETFEDPLSSGFGRAKIELLKVSFFYKEMVDKIIKETKEEGLFIPRELSSLLLLHYLLPIINKVPIEERKKWCDNLISKPCTVHLVFSKIEIDCLKTLMRLSAWVTYDYLKRFIDGQPYKNMKSIEHLEGYIDGLPYEGKNKPEIKELVRQVRTCLWWALLRTFEAEAKDRIALSNKRAYEDFKRIFGDKLLFQTEIGLKDSKEINLRKFDKIYQELYTKPAGVSYFFRKSFSCDGPFDSFLGDLNQVDWKVRYWIENQRLFMEGLRE